MTARIRVLDDTLIDQIAAGEVVERPASVVKELVENAIDAGATSIRVEIDDGGRSRIRVSDDGIGMSRADAELAVRRHATSKIRCVDDLLAIRSLGFRGEALPSIASVSKFRLVTREHDALEGTSVAIDGGQLLGIETTGTAAGTTIEARDLFYNVPARLKFLKARATEAGAVFDVCLRAALANPSVRLTVTHDGRRMREFLPVADLAMRAETALSEEGLATIRGARDGLEVVASLGSPEHAQRGTRGLHCFVNGRPVNDVKLARAVAFAYGSVLPPGRYPSGVVHLAIAPDEVDVNAHPQKAEVRFARGREVLDALTRALAQGLGTQAFSRPSFASTGGPAARGASYWDARFGADTATSTATPTDDASAFARALAGASLASTTAYDAPRPTALATADGTRNENTTARAYDDTASQFVTLRDRPTASLVAEPGFYGSLRFLGQARKTFLVCEGADGLYVLDQHAVDERIVYHGLRTAYAERTVKTQRLLFPERVELRPEDADLAEAANDALLAAGVECTRLGTSTVAIHTVPALLGRASPTRLLRDLLDELGRTGERTFGDSVDTALATMACHGAIRAGDTLAPEESLALLRALDAIDAFAGHCPHGRPVVTVLPFSELERKLGR